MDGESGQGRREYVGTCKEWVMNVYGEIEYRMATLDFNEDLFDLQDLLDLILRRDDNLVSPGLFCSLPDSEAFTRVKARMDALTPEEYRNGAVDIAEGEVVNGYELYPEFSRRIPLNIHFALFERLARRYFLDPPEIDMTLQEFLEAYRSTACSDWAKMDDRGSSFGGFWDYPEGSPERENAMNLTFDSNARKLFKLPFPKGFLIKTIEMGCEYRMESVRFSNFLGVWFQRKILQMKLGE